MNHILSNQDTVLGQITQLESSITQTEVINTATLGLTDKMLLNMELTPVSS